MTIPFPFAGEAAALLGALAWSIGSIYFAVAFKKFSPNEAAWYKNACACIFLFVVSFFASSQTINFESLSWLAISGILGLGLGDWLYFLAIAHIGISRTVIICQAVPALTALLDWSILGKHLSGVQLSGVALVILGGIVAESQRFRTSHSKFDQIGVKAALLCVLLWTISNLTVYKGMQETDPFSGAAIRLLTGALFFGVWFYRKKTLKKQLRFLISKSAFKLLAIPTFIGTCIGMVLNVSSYKWTSASIAATLGSTVPLFAIPLSILILKEKPGWTGWVGASIVIIGALLVGYDFSLS